MAKKIHALGEKALELCGGNADDAQFLLDITAYIHRGLKD